MNYKKPRTYPLTPTRKHLGKAVARGSKKSVAIECLKDPATRKFLLKGIGVLVRNELKSMCMDSRSSISSENSDSRSEEFYLGHSIE